MITLPATPGPVSLDWRHVDYGGTLSAPLGGETQRLNRLGNRLAVTVALPPMTVAQAGAWVGALNAAVREGARWNVRQVELAIGTPGSPVVDGSGAGGATLPIKGATPGYAFAAGQFVTTVAGGGRCLHIVRTAATVDGAGKATLTVDPPLRLPLSDGDQVLVAQPTIEGLIEGDGFGWTIDRARRFGLGFTIVEQR